MTKRNTWALTGLGALLLGGSLWAYQRSHRKPETKFETSQVDRGRIVAKVTATGTLSALVTVQIGSQVSGRVRELFADFNSPVKKGQVLAKIDPQLFQAALEQGRANHLAANADLTAAKVKAMDAERQFNRAKSLADRKLIAQADLDTAQANAESAQATVEAARGRMEQTRASLHQAQVNLEYTTITSPIDGIVVSRSVDVGQTVAASLQAPVLFVLAEDLKKMQVDTSIAEADIGKLSPGMAADFAVDAFPAERFRGGVRQIRNSPQTVQNVVTYDAVIDVDNSELKLRPGMTANVTLVYAEKKDALRIPNAALRYRPASEVQGGGQPGAGAGAAGQRPRSNRPPEEPGRKTVWVLQELRPHPVSIKPGVSDGTLTEVAEGDLKVGDAVITDAQRPEGASKGPGGGGGQFRRMF